MQEIKCPNCGEVFAVDESGYAQIVQQVRDKEFEKALEQREKDFAERKESELKLARMKQKEEFEKTINQVLTELVEKGINKKSLEAAINHYEFQYREADFGSYPRGLMLGLQALDSWLYDKRQPFMHIEANETFQELRDSIETGYFEELIQKWLLDNTHGSIVTVKPERGRTARLDQELEKRLEVYKNSLTDAEKERLIADTAALEDYQESEDAQEDREKIPS